MKLLVTMFGVIFSLLSAQLGWCGPVGLSRVESDGYLMWLHSLEKAVEARVATELPEASKLFPFDLEVWNLEDPRPYRHLSISKAVTELEAQWNNRGNGNIDSALMALANARNYVNLSEYDSALVWYEAAAALDSSGSFEHEIAREGLACAISAKDSLAVAQLTTNALGASELAGRQSELILVYRQLLIGRDGESLDILIQKLEAHPENLSPRLRFWHAYALSWLGRTEQSLKHLRVLVATGGQSHGLTEWQRGWVLRATADAFFLLDDHHEARDLYASLASCGILELKLWGKYQVAGLEFIENKFLRAGNGFQQVCEGKRFGSWQDEACAMVDITRDLQVIKNKGERYGVANFYEK